MANKIEDIDATTNKGYKKVNVRLDDTFTGYRKESSNGNPMISLYGQYVIGGKIYQMTAYLTEKQ